MVVIARNESRRLKNFQNKTKESLNEMINNCVSICHFARGEIIRKKVTGQATLNFWNFSTAYVHVVSETIALARNVYLFAVNRDGETETLVLASSYRRKEAARVSKIRARMSRLIPNFWLLSRWNPFENRQGIGSHYDWSFRPYNELGASPIWNFPGRVQSA